MRILISADIEGISGVMSPEQTSPGSGEYERARLLMTREVNAAVEGALEGGATEIWVADGHGQYNNPVGRAASGCVPGLWKAAPVWYDGRP